MDEPEIVAGMLPLAEAQAAFAGSPDVRWQPLFCQTMWYDISVDPRRGYFGMIQANNERMEPLVGEIVRVRYRTREINVYILGGAELPVEFALTRKAFLRLDLLWQPAIPVRLDVLVTASDG